MISSQFLQSCQSGDEAAIQNLVRTYQRAVFQLALSVIDDAPLDEAPDGDASAKAGGADGRSPRGSAAAEAEAATRETFIRAIDRLGRYREDTNFETWLFAIAIEVSRRRARGWRVRRALVGVFQRAWRAVFPLPPEQPKEDPNRAFYRPIPEQTPAEAAAAKGSSAKAAAEASTKASAEAAAAGPAHTNLAPGQRFHPGDAELWSSVRRLNEAMRVPVVLRYYHDYSIADIARLLHISEGTVHARLDAAREKIALRDIQEIEKKD